MAQDKGNNQRRSRLFDSLIYTGCEKTSWHWTRKHAVEAARIFRLNGGKLIQLPK